MRLAGPLVFVAALLSGGISAANGMIQINPSPIDFPCGVTSLTVQITNVGNSNLSVSNIMLGGADSGDFLVDVGAFAPPWTIPAGRSYPIQVEFLAMGPGARAAQLFIASNDPLTPNAFVPISGTSGQFTASPNPLDFGIVQAGIFAHQMLTLTNKACANVTIKQITFKDPQGWFATNAVPPLVVATGAVAMIDVTATAKAAGMYAAEMDITTDIPMSPPIGVKLLANGVEPSIQVDPKRIDFGYVGVSSTATQQLMVSNVGAGPLTVTAFNLADPAGAFSLTTPKTPVVIPPNNTMTIDVRCSPRGGGDLTGSIEIDSNGLGMPATTVMLKGIGVAPDLAVARDLGVAGDLPALPMDGSGCSIAGPRRARPPIAIALLALLLLARRRQPGSAAARARR